MPDHVSGPDSSLLRFFRTALLDWSHRHPRPMPWKGEKDPYKIWLSEIILQQTRVEQGLPYYQKFIAHYPSVKHLAQAPEDQLLKDWEGLGYYSRARNLHAAARYIAQHLDGQFPQTYEAIRALKGVGPYTAAAIASFAYGLPHAVLDGNVYRILARFFGVSLPIHTPQAQKVFSSLAQQLLPVESPAAHNQAMMDFGAIWCTPAQPQCARCPMQEYCRAFQEGRVAELPVKQKALVRKKRSFHYMVLRHRGEVYVRKRSGKDIWKGLWEFPYTENAVSEVLLSAGNARVSGPFRQLLTHQEITAWFYEMELPDELPEQMIQSGLLKDCQTMPFEALKKNIAFPKVIDCFFQSKDLTLN